MAEALAIVRSLVSIVETAEPNDPRLFAAVAELQSGGITQGMHVGGSPMELTGDPNLGAEWLLGQFIDIVERRAWGAMNTWLNLCQVAIDNAA